MMGPPRECLFWDISEAGAKITVQDPADLPEYVTIVLSDAARAERHYRIVWRSELDVGVKFVADASKTTSENPNAGAVSEEQQAS